MLWIKN